MWPPESVDRHNFVQTNAIFMRTVSTGRTLVASATGSIHVEECPLAQAWRCIFVRGRCSCRFLRATFFAVSFRRLACFGEIRVDGTFLARRLSFGVLESTCSAWRAHSFAASVLAKIAGREREEMSVSAFEKFLRWKYFIMRSKKRKIRNYI